MRCVPATKIPPAPLAQYPVACDPWIPGSLDPGIPAPLGTIGKMTVPPRPRGTQGTYNTKQDMQTRGHMIHKVTVPPPLWVLYTGGNLVVMCTRRGLHRKKAGHPLC